MRDYADSDTVRATIQVEVKENIHKGFTPVSSTVSKPVFILKKGKPLCVFRCGKVCCPFGGL